MDDREQAMDGDDLAPIVTLGPTVIACLLACRRFYLVPVYIYLTLFVLALKMRSYTLAPEETSTRWTMMVAQ